MSLIPESQEVIEKRLMSRDFGPDIAVVLPREHWLLLVMNMSEVQDEYPVGRFPVDKVVAEMRAFALHKMASAVRDSIDADNRRGRTQ